MQTAATFMLSPKISTGEHGPRKFPGLRVHAADQEFSFAVRRDQVSVHELLHVMRDSGRTDLQTADDIDEMTASSDLQRRLVPFEEFQIDPQTIRVRERAENFGDAVRIGHDSIDIEE